MNKNGIALVLNLFVTVGVNIHQGNSSTLKRCLKKFLEICFHLYSLYFIILCVYLIYNKGLKDGENLVASVYFLIVAFLRLHFVFKKEKIFEVCKYATDSISFDVYKSDKHLKIYILVYFFFNLILSCFVSYKEFSFTSNRSEALQMYKYLLFDLPVSSEYFLILTSALEFCRNFLELQIPALTTMILCILYKMLADFMKRVRFRIDNIIKTQDGTAKQLTECTQLLSEACNIVSKVEKEMSVPLFYLITIHVLQIMALISIFASRDPEIVASVIFFFIAANSILSLLFVVNLASKVSDIFTAVKTNIIISDFAKKGIYSELPEAIGIIGLGIVMNEMVNSFQITAFGAVKMNKALIITILCSFVSYGIILFQIFNNKN